jgi:hypothetical protein
MRARGSSAAAAPGARDLQELIPPPGGREGEQGQRRSGGWAEEQRMGRRERPGKEGEKSRG